MEELIVEWVALVLNQAALATSCLLLVYGQHACDIRLAGRQLTVFHTARQALWGVGPDIPETKRKQQYLF